MAREISDSVQVGGLKTVAAALGLNPATGLILGSGVAANPPAALGDLFMNVSAGAADKTSGSPRILCSPELASVIRACLPTVWRTAEIVPAQPDVAVEDLFDSLVGHLAGRQQPSDMPSPEDWSMLFRQAQAFVEAAPWRRLPDDVHLHMDLRVGGDLSH